MASGGCKGKHVTVIIKSSRLVYTIIFTIYSYHLYSKA